MLHSRVIARVNQTYCRRFLANMPNKAGKPRICDDQPSRHPPGLRGKEIGLWYAAHSKKHSRNNLTTNFDLTGVNMERIQSVIQDVRSDSTTGASSKPKNTPTPGFTSFQQDGDLHNLGDANELFNELKDSLDVSFDPLPDADPMYSQGESLSRRPQLDDELRNALLCQQSSQSYQQMLVGRSKLPVFLKKDELISRICENQILVISGETGCGKTTQIPQYLLEDAVSKGKGSITRILVTQPRRISAISVAERVAAERGESIGSTVGYQIRLERCLPRSIPGSITFCTTGIVLQWLRSDPLLKNVSHIVVDEVHEREFLCDFLLNMLRRIVFHRPDIRIVLMSATLNAEKFSEYFGGCPRLEIEGRLFPVQEKYLEEVISETGFWLPSNNLRDLAVNQSSRAQRRLISTGSLPRRDAKRISKQISDGLVSWLRSCSDQGLGG